MSMSTSAPTSAPAPAPAPTPAPAKSAVASPAVVVVSATMGDVLKLSEADEQKYKKMSELEHLLHRPDMYVGSIERIQAQLSLIDHSSEKPTVTQVMSEYCPALLKIIDEAIVNILDHSWRVNTANAKTTKTPMKKAEKAKAMLLPVTNIEVSINTDTREVCILNDGEGIDIAMHEKHSVYVPELIFAHFRTGTNFNDSDNKCTGGKNGFGIKLVNAFSTRFEVETVDRLRKLKYTQLFENNLTVTHPPTIVPYDGTPYTKLTFVPDLPRFGMHSGWTTAMQNIIEKRAYDLSACAGSAVKVSFNGQVVPVKDFHTYMSMFPEAAYGCFSEVVNDRWEVGVALSEDGFKQQSFVNGVCTIKGGKHVDYIANQIARHVCARILEKKKVVVKPMFVRENLMLFVKAMIANPAFDGQTKETLTTPSAKFGSTCELPAAFMEKLYPLGLMERVIELYQFKELAKTKKEDGKRHGRISGIPKLDDANKAGGKESAKCTLILTEGDSAKAMAIAGLSVIGRDYYGVFPLRGKMINSRDKMTTIKGLTQMGVNEEMVNLKKILGLEQGKQYLTEEDISKNLRYGKVMVMTDQDVDGTHIKGLFMNWIDSQWKELMKLNFVTSMITPIIKVTKKTAERSFYSIGEYLQWSETAEGKAPGWKTKYYKGLGTSTTNEAKAYFREFRRQEYFYDEKDSEPLDMAFSKDRADDRKAWMQNYDIFDTLDPSQQKVSCSEFIDKDLKHFSVYDTQRSIPNLIDGLKTSQRKILYGCFKRKLTKEIKVAQLAGYVSEHTGYHHGEMSLNMAIIAMAQQFVGSNNLNLLQPNGQFGTRLQGGKDSASPRYIFTQLSTATNLLFHPDDQPLLEYLDDDGQQVEPKYYVPILPVALMNGAHGVGTGYSTSIPMYDPLQVCDVFIARLKDCMKQQQTGLAPTAFPDLQPSYAHFRGSVTKLKDTSYLTKGKYFVKDYKTVIITELPVDKWTDDYKEFLETLLVDYTPPKKKGASAAATKALPSAKHAGVLKQYTSHCTESDVYFELEFKPDVLQQWLNTQHDDAHIDYFEKQLKLTSKVSLTNMHLFDADSRIHKYDGIVPIMDAFFDVRHDYYGRRKTHQLGVLNHELDVIRHKVKFLEAVIGDTIVVGKQSKAQLVATLEELLYPKFVTGGDAPKTACYNYLLTMPIYTLTTDTLEALRKQCEVKQADLTALESTTVEAMWLGDLTAFRKEFVSMQTKLAKLEKAAEGKTKPALLNPPKKKPTKAKAKGTAAAAAAK